MAFTANEFGRSLAAPGLVVPNNPYTTLSGCMADDSSLEGGFPLFRIPGDDVRVYATKPSEVSGVARVLEVTPVLGTAAAGTVKVKKNGVVVASATTTSESTVATVIDALVASWDEDLYTPTDGTTKLTVTAKAQTADRNADVFEMEYSDGVGFSGNIAQTTAGVTAKAGGAFLGVAERIATRDEYPAGTPVTVITKGQTYVLVAADVTSGSSAYVTSEGGWGTSGTQVSNGKYITSAAAGGFAILELS